MSKIGFAKIAVVMALGWSTASNAAPIIIDVQGLFENGQSVSGQFTEEVPGSANFRDILVTVGSLRFRNITAGYQTSSGFVSLTFGNFAGDELTLETNNGVQGFNFSPNGGTLLTSSTYTTGGRAVNLVIGSFTQVAAAVPEPATWGMMMLGFGGMGYAMRRKANKTRIRFA